MITVEEIRGNIEKMENQIVEMLELLRSMENEQPGRVEKGKCYYSVGDDGRVEISTDCRDEWDEDLYACGNYYLTEADAIRAEKQIRLFRLLDRFSRQNGWTDEVWEDDKTDKWYIYFSYFWGNVYKPSKACYRDICQVYFVSEYVAQQAIEKYHDLIVEVMAI
jgi:hypothetical protein